MNGHSSYFICESDTKLEASLHDAPEYPGTAYLWLNLPLSSCHVQASVDTLEKIADAIYAYILAKDTKALDDGVEEISKICDRLA